LIFSKTFVDHLQFEQLILSKTFVDHLQFKQLIFFCLKVKLLESSWSPKINWIWAVDKKNNYCSNGVEQKTCRADDHDPNDCPSQVKLIQHHWSFAVRSSWPGRLERTASCAAASALSTTCTFTTDSGNTQSLG
jgi:hypothetical protein